MTDLDTLDLSDGAVLTIPTPGGTSIVSTELEGDRGLFWAAKTVGLYLEAGYTLAEGGADRG